MEKKENHFVRSGDQKKRNMNFKDKSLNQPPKQRTASVNGSSPAASASKNDPFRSKRAFSPESGNKSDLTSKKNSKSDAAPKRKKGIKDIFSMSYVPAFPIFFILMETVARFAIFNGIFDTKYILLLLTATATGFLFSGICSFLHNKLKKWVTVVLMSVITAVYAFLISYYRYFGTFFSWKTSGQAGNVIKYFMENIIDAFLKSCFITLIIFIPTILFAVFYKPKQQSCEKERSQSMMDRICSLIGLLCTFVAIFGFWAIGGGMSFKSDRYYYKFIQSDLSEAYFRYGMFNISRIEIEQIMFGEPHEDLKGIYGSLNVDPVGEQTPAENEEIDYGLNQVEIDFEKIKKDNPKVANDIEYFERLEPTNKNEYTGMFKDYNIIFMTLESFSPAIIDPEFTPLLYQMSTEGFVFNNYYMPMWSGATETGEYTNLTGNPSQRANSLVLACKSVQPYTMGRMFTKQGYEVWGYHNNWGSYYSRNQAYPAIGYTNFKTLETMNLKRPDIWPRSDLEMGMATVDDYIHSDTPFHAYYMTLSGHCQYLLENHGVAQRHIKDLPKKYASYNKDAQCYLAAQYDVELMLEFLVEKLKEEGKYENTLFVMTPDHYPYALKKKSVKQLYGEDAFEDYNYYKSCLFMWSPSIKEPIVIDKYCSSIDILPTVYNLFGIEYDSRLITGTDIMSNSMGIAFFYGKGTSWKTDQGSYYAEESKFVPSDSCSLSPDMYDDYVDNINNRLALKTKFSVDLLQKNYYSYFLDYIQ